MNTPNHKYQQSPTQGFNSKSKKDSGANIDQSQSSMKRSLTSFASAILYEALLLEKDFDRTILTTMYTEYCDKSLTQAQCPMKELCLKAHQENQITIRRSPFTADYTQLRYIPSLCPNPELCTKKESCSFAHSQEEARFHPTIFKTELCPNVGNCQLKIHCSYAHSTSDVRNASPYFILNSQPQSTQGSTINSSSAGGSANSFQGNSNLPIKMSGLCISKSNNNFYTGSTGNLQQETESKGYYPQPVGNNKNGLADDDVIASIDLFNFKTQQCKVPNQHNPKKCFFYHEVKKDRRRMLGTYTSEICPYILSNQTHHECQMGDNCSKAHNRVEEFYHPEKYKVKFCSSYPDRIESCDYGDMCAFAHSEAELTVDLLDKFEKNADFYIFHFKTIWCPYSDTTHARDACVYAHNWQDFRRKPHMFEYERDQCPLWQTKSFIQTYADGCKHEYRCKYSHGWKEQEYHPFNYKLHACRVGDSCQKYHCPYFHSEKDRRHPLNSNFKLFPKNRGFSVHASQIYQPIYLNLLFNMPSRTCQTVVDQLTGTQQLQYITQSIYGCSPQSIPILDPKIVFAYQQSQLMKSQSTTTTMTSHLPIMQQQEQQQRHYKSNNLSQSNVNYYPQPNQPHIPHQSQFGRVQSHNQMLPQNLTSHFGSGLSTQSAEFKKVSTHHPNFHNQDQVQMISAPPGFDDLNLGGTRFQTSSSFQGLHQLEIEKLLRLQSLSTQAMNQGMIQNNFGGDFNQLQPQYQGFSQQSLQPAQFKQNAYSQPNLLQLAQQQQQFPQQQNQQQFKKSNPQMLQQHFDEHPSGKMQHQQRQQVTFLPNLKPTSIIQEKLEKSSQQDLRQQQRKKSEYYDEIDVNLNEPFSDEEYEEEDDFKDIKYLIESSQKKNLEQQNSEIESFLKDNNLQYLSQFIQSLNLKTLSELQSYNKEQIRGYLGQENQDICEELMKALSNL